MLSRWRAPLSALLLLGMIPASVRAAPPPPYTVTWDPANNSTFAFAFFRAVNDDLSDPSHAVFSLRNGSVMWYSFQVQRSSQDVTLAAANPLADPAATVLEKLGLVPPTGPLRLTLHGSLTEQALTLAAHFTGPGQQMRITLDPYTQVTVTLDALDLLLVLLGGTDAQDLGLVAPGGVQLVLSQVKRIADLGSFVTDVGAMLRAYPDAKAMLDSAFAAAKDLTALFKDGEETKLLANVLWAQQGGDVPLDDMVSAIGSFSKYWGLTVKLGFDVFAFVRDEILTVASGFSTRGQPTVSLGTTATGAPTPTPSTTDPCVPRSPIDYSQVPATPMSTPGPAANIVRTAVTTRSVDTNSFVPTDVTTHFTAGDKVFVVLGVRGVPAGSPHTVSARWFLQGEERQVSTAASCVPVPLRSVGGITQDSNVFLALLYPSPGVGMAKFYWDGRLAQTVVFGVYPQGASVG